MTNLNTSPTSGIRLSQRVKFVGPSSTQSVHIYVAGDAKTEFFSADQAMLLVSGYKTAKAMPQNRAGVLREEGLFPFKLDADIGIGPKGTSGSINVLPLHSLSRFLSIVARRPIEAAALRTTTTKEPTKPELTVGATVSDAVSPTAKTPATDAVASLVAKAVKEEVGALTGMIAKMSLNLKRMGELFVQKLDNVEAGSKSAADSILEIKRILAEVDAAPPVKLPVAADEPYMDASGYCMATKMATRWASQLGRIATRLCREENILVRKSKSPDHPEFGEMNSYPVTVLRRATDAMLAAKASQA